MINTGGRISFLFDVFTYTCKFSPGENFHQFNHLLSWQNFYHTNFLSSVNDYIEDKAILTTLAKICFTKCFCSTKVAYLAKFLSSMNSDVYGIYSTHHIIISPKLHAIITVVSNFTREPTS